LLESPGTPAPTASPSATGRRRLDTAALEAFLRGRGFAGPLAAEQFKGGQSNPTYLVTGRNGRLVLRAKPGPAPKLLPSAHAVERHVRVISALGQTGVPDRNSTRLTSSHCPLSYHVLAFPT